MTTSIATRLHITPLNADLLPIVLGPNLTRLAQNIEYQRLETFPENNYGFVDLPETEARTLISKLNGAILKGKKMKIEKARSKKRSRSDAPAEADVQELTTSPKKVRKAKREEDVIEGHEISPERKVKRGWTKPKAEESIRSKSKDKRKEKKSKHQPASQYTEKEELLFRTKLPANKEHLDIEKPRSSGKEKKIKQKAAGTVIHEFQNTEIQPAFVRDATSSAPTAEYVDNVGWVDGKGDMIEKASSTLSQRRSRKAEGLRIGIPDYTRAKPTGKQAKELDSASSVRKSTPAASDDDATDLQESPSSTLDTSSSASSSGSDSESDEPEKATLDSNDDLQKGAMVNPETPEKVHPLEAIFKKPQPRIGQEAAKPSLEIETTFSFFDQPDVDEEDALPPMPTTPFTPRDMHSRGVRSAAPTPDTAHPSRFAGFANALAAGTIKDQTNEDATISSLGNEATGSDPDQSGERGQSDFEKRFWAERGQNNRAWKAQRKTAIKEQRQKENRLRRPKNW